MRLCVSGESPFLATSPSRSCAVPRSRCTLYPAFWMSVHSHGSTNVYPLEFRLLELAAFTLRDSMYTVAYQAMQTIAGQASAAPG